jgi:LEA14-like dessication related protein
MLNLVKAIVITSLLACAPAGVTQQYEKPKVELKAISIQSVDWSKRTANTTVSIEIDNKGPAFKLKDLSYRLKVNGTQAAEGKHDKEVDVAAESKTTVGVPCVVDLTALPGLTWSAISSGFDVSYELETEFTVPLFGSLGPRIQNTFKGDLSLSASLSSISSRIKDRLSKLP